MLTETQVRTAGWGNTEVQALRARALAFFEEKGLPEVKNELYKYSNIQRLVTENGFRETEPKTATDTLNLPELPFAVSGTLVLYNGVFQPALSALPAGVDVQAAGAILDGPLAAHTFGLPEPDAVKALALATASEGVALLIGDNVQLEKPLLVFSYTDVEDASSLASLHVLKAGKNASASVLMLHAHTAEKRFFAQQVWQYFTAEGATLRVYEMQNEGPESYTINHFSALQAANSTFSLTTSSTGSAFMRNNVRAEHAGEGCHTELNGLFMPSEGQHIDNRTFVGHMFPNCTSDEMYKGIAAADGKGIFNGKVYVARDAQKTNAYQSNKNVLLSREATINSKPELEIYADDVKCSHGSTTGQLDEQSIFYMQARGIRQAEARKLLLLAFANDVFERIPDRELRAFFETEAEQRFAALYRSR